MPLKFLFIALITTFRTFSAHAVPAQGSHMMMAGPSSYAIEAGQEIALAGGNVVDVAVTMGLTLAVTSPYYAALGGGGFALISMNKKVEVLDFREVAPALAKEDFYLNKPKDASVKGGTAVAVPGFPAGLWALHKKYGKLHWSRLFKRPIALAQSGFRVSGEWVENTIRAKDLFTSTGRRRFFKPNGEPYRPGELFRQKDLARVLKEMSNRNITSFYQGVVAKDIVDSVKAAGGMISLSDLKHYDVRWLTPLETTFNGYRVYLMPPPSSGGVVIQTALNLLERLKVSEQKPLSTQELHLIGEILSRSFRGRSLLGDPDFTKNPIAKLTSSAYLEKLAASIDKDKSEKLKPLNDDEFFKKESEETTHYSVMDQQGNAIALTVTLNGNYGSGVVTEKYGIALNNEMDDFTTRPGEPNMFGLVQGSANKIEPGKRPLSSMSPTLVAKNNNVIMTLGAPGGPRIISAVLQVLYRTLANQWDMDTAIQAPRVHHQFLPHELVVDKNRLSPDVLEGLKKKNHEIKESWVGKVYGVRKTANGNLEAAFDSRGEGGAGGY